MVSLCTIIKIISKLEEQFLEIGFKSCDYILRTNLVIRVFGRESPDYIFHKKSCLNYMILSYIYHWQRSNAYGEHIWEIISVWIDQVIR